MADVAYDDDRVRVGVGDGVVPDAGHVNDDVVGGETLGGGGVFRDIPVDQGEMRVVGVRDEVRGQTDGDIAGPV